MSPKQIESEMDPKERTKMIALHGRDWMFSRQQTVADLRSKLEKFHQQSISSTDLLGQKTSSSSSLRFDVEEKEKKDEDEKKKDEQEDDK